jgi:pyruvate formate lyase activating enzyme
MTPREVVDMAVSYGAHGIAYTYNEPSIFIEFAKDCGIEAHKMGIFIFLYQMAMTHLILWL